MQTNFKIKNFKLLSLLMIFAIPIVVSWVLYYYRDFFHFKTTNLGTLVRPAVHVNDLAEPEGAHNSWQIVYAPLSCNGEAEKTMFTLHQLRTALGKNQERVSLTLVTIADCQLETHDFRKLIFTKKQLTQLKNALIKSQPDNFTVGDKIYLIDPIGNLFMYYSSETNPMNILKDIKKVLEVSQIG